MTNLRVRALQPVDRGAAAELFCDAFPLRAQEVDTWREPPSPTAARRWVTRAGRSDQVIAYSALWRFRSDGSRMDLVVAPDRRRRGVGSEVLAELVRAAAGDGARTLQARADDGWSASLDFLRAHDFVETMRMHRQLLRMAEATLERHRGIEPRLAGEGITITTLEHEEAREPACWTRFCELHHAARDGWVDPDPRPEPDPAWSPEEFRRRYQRAAAFRGDRPDGCFLAVQGDRYIGFTGALGTGVHPRLRGRGIATALKVRVVGHARDRGVSTLATSSASPAMLHINERLGFRRTSTEIRLVKPLGSTANA
jgi:GNAT superfamily N-acetyltransferase